MIPAINTYIYRIIVLITGKMREDRGGGREKGGNVKKCRCSQCIKKIYVKSSYAHIYAYTHTKTYSQREANMIIVKPERVFSSTFDREIKKEKRERKRRSRGTENI